MQQAQIIGRRVLALSQTESVTVTIYIPVVTTNGDYQCCYVINGGPWAGKSKKVLGIDSLQAVILAMQAIGTEFKYYNEQAPRKVSWLGANSEGDVGFPALAEN